MSFLDDYRRLGHAIQSGTAMEQARGSESGTPKHLRTGLNLVMSDVGSLARLLIEKGVFTLEEYEAALLTGLEEEKARSEARLSTQLGTTITLG